MALDAFLQFTDDKNPGAAPINGETQDVQMSKLKPRPFDIQSWSFGASQQVNVGSSSMGMGAGKVEFQPFKITKQCDQSSPYFFQTCAQGGHYKECTLYVRKGGGSANSTGTVYLRFDFKMVFVTEIGWSHDDTAPKEDVTFEYGALQMAYTKQLRTGAPVKEIKVGDGTSTNPGGEKLVAWSKLYNNDKFEVPES